MQSSIVDVLSQIRQDVKDGTNVLFIGTPCQVTAVKRMYEEQPDNLFLVDLICHGVPSNKWLVDYIANTLKIKADKVSSIGFRLFEAFSLCVYNDDRLIYKSAGVTLN